MAALLESRSEVQARTIPSSSLGPKQGMTGNKVSLYKTAIHETTGDDLRNVLTRMRDVMRAEPDGTNA